jgi:hypothetical protein
MTCALPTGPEFRALAATMGAWLADHVETTGLLPVGLADQITAATRDTTTAMQRLAAAKAATTIEADLNPLVVGYFSLTLSRCRPCPHLAMPCPVIAALALERVLCHPCAQAVHGEPVGHGDRCDWCHQTGISEFWPLELTAGPVLILGDACHDCTTNIIPIGRDK